MSSPAASTERERAAQRARATLCARANWARYEPGQTRGHYESFFLRANHPTRPLAFWIRYTLFSPHRRPGAAIGELWAVAFDGDTGHHVAVKREVPVADCEFDRGGLGVRIADARLAPGEAAGTATAGAHGIAWDLRFEGAAPPLLLLAPHLYAARLPKAKSIVGLPLARFDGTLTVDGAPLAVTGWVGSQNHNWGSRHTDHYAWGQVCGFDDHPDTFLEVGTARVRLGPLWTPFMTVLVLRHRGEELAINTLRQAYRARASFSYFTWQFTTAAEGVRIEGTIRAPAEAFVGLTYLNPPGGVKHCLNSKLAACELQLTDQRRGTPRTETLTTRHRAAFEILTDDTRHGIAMRV